MLSKGALLQANILNVWKKNRSHIVNGENVRNVTIMVGGTVDGGGLFYPRGDYNLARPGIWARGLDGLKLINCKFYDDGGSRREKFLFDTSVQHVDTKAMGK